MPSLARILSALSMAILVSNAWAAPALPQEPTLDQVVARMSEYVAAYGARASIIVAVEHYTQQVTSEEGRVLRPRMLVGDVAIVKAPDRIGWTGFRDVVEVNGEPVADRRDRLLALLTGPAGGEGELRRIANESARYNVGPVARNFNVPTTVLFFFHPERVSRFTFRKGGTKTIDGTRAWELDFKETGRPTLVAKRDGTDVPCEGTVWVIPEDGTVVRTRMRMRRFADVLTMSEGNPARNARAGSSEAASQGYGQPTPTQVPPTQPAQPPAAPPQQAPSQPAPPPSGGGSGGASGGGGAAGGGNAAPVHQPPPREFGEAFFPEMREIESSAEIDVTYKRDPDSSMWLPAKMSEVYEGAIPRGTSAPLVGRAVGLAKYSGFRRFETSVRIVPPR